MSGSVDVLLDHLDLLLDEGDVLIGCHHIEVDTNGCDVFVEGLELPIHEGMLDNESLIGIYGHNLLDSFYYCGGLLVGKVVSGGQS